MVLYGEITIDGIIQGVLVAALVVVTFLSLQRYSAREKRDRKERLLNEVKEWAKEAVKAAMIRQKRDATELWETKLKYKYSVATSEYITKVVNDSFKNLSPYVNKVVDKLNEAIQITEEAIEESEGVEFYNTIRVVKQEEELSDAVKELLKALASINYKSPS